MSRVLWIQMVQESAPFPISDQVADLMYHRAASAYGFGQTLILGPGSPDELDLTKTFEQYRMLEILRGEQHGKK
jgi:hypothetical protein